MTAQNKNGLEIVKPEPKVRQLNIDLSTGFPRHWLGNDPFRTQVLNAMSLSFPLGEQYFIDSLRASLPLIKDPDLYRQAKGFIGQEASHRHLHIQYNQELERQGLRHFIAPFLKWRIKRSARLSLQSKVAISAAYEHYTAMFSNGVLGKANMLQDAAEPLRSLWEWHCAEEIEHKSIVFDVYKAIGGGYWRRIGWYVYVTIFFSIDSILQTINNLYRDKQLFKWRNIPGVFKMYFSRHGLFTGNLIEAIAYLRPGFSPWHSDNRDLSERWLTEHAGRYRNISDNA